MLTRRHFTAALGGGLLAAPLVGRASAQTAVPAGYPADYAQTIAAAEREGKVVVYSPTDATQNRPIVEAFRQAYPRIQVEWNDLNTNQAFNRVVSEVAANQLGADLVWSSAMDLQLNLVDRGIAAQYVSPEAAALPAWARYKDSAYGTTVEAACIVHNKRLLPTEQVPTNRDALIRFLRERRAQVDGKTCTFDPEQSGTGFMWSTSDQRNTSNFWELVRAFGAANGKVYSSSGQMREKVVSGEHVLAFNCFASYGEEWARRSSSLGVVYQTDYTPAISRVAFATKSGPNQNAGRVFLDFMLSKAGQAAAARGGLPSIRTDVTDVANITSVNRQANGNLKPIPLDETITQYMDSARRTAFLAEWRRNLSQG